MVIHVTDPKLIEKTGGIVQGMSGSPVIQMCIRDRLTGEMPNGGIFYGSDYFETCYDCAVALIKAGKAYVCDLTQDEIREYRGTLTEPGKNSPYRDRSVEENLQLFQDMRDGKFPDGSKTLRAKIDMASPNMNMRDPAIYRIVRAHHHRPVSYTHLPVSRVRRLPLPAVRA